MYVTQGRARLLESLNGTDFWADAGNPTGVGYMLTRGPFQHVYPTRPLLDRRQGSGKAGISVWGHVH